MQPDGTDVAAATGVSFHEMDGPHGLDSFRATIDLNLIGSRLAAGQMSSLGISRAGHRPSPFVTGLTKGIPAVPEAGTAFAPK